jgi:hypothetical protein
MAVGANEILEVLRGVAAQRARRSAEPALAAGVTALKRYQQERFRRTYADLLESPRFGDAARFFLEELYGPDDFTARDAQFARVVPALARLFPSEVVETVLALVRLHALTEELDTAMAEQLGGAVVERSSYLHAWQATDRELDRRRQLDLTLDVGRDLDRLTRKPLLRQTLHLMRGPARAAGLQQLQRFLERGFDAFRGMRGAQPFLDLVAQREAALISGLFAAASDATGDPGACGTGVLGQLP